MEFDIVINNLDFVIKKLISKIAKHSWQYNLYPELSLFETKSQTKLQKKNPEFY